MNKDLNGRALLLFYSFDLLFSHVLVAVAVVIFLGSLSHSDILVASTCPLIKYERKPCTLKMVTRRNSAELPQKEVMQNATATRFTFSLCAYLLRLQFISSGVNGNFICSLSS